MKTNSKIYIIAIVAMAIFVMGCSKVIEQPVEEPCVQVSTPENAVRLTKSESIALVVQKKGTYKISETEALDKLDRFAASNSENKSADIQVKSTTLKTNPSTSKEMYYEIVFESEKGTGFSLISADERLDEILCFVEQGSLKDTLDNSGLQWFFLQMRGYIDEMMKTELDIDLLYKSAVEKQVANNPPTKAVPAFDPNIWTFSHYETITSGAQVSKPVPVKWGQGYPFNIIQDPAGCSTIAVTQVMAYWRKNYKNIVTSTSQWDAMRQSIYHATIPVLMSDVYDELYWRFLFINDIPPFMSDVRSFMTSNGYSCGSVHSGYSFSVLKSALQYGPTIISGMKNLVSGHYWVVDGIDDRRYDDCEVWIYDYNGKIFEHRVFLSSTGGDYVQFNWGNYGNGDAWVSSGVLSYQGNNYSDLVRIISSIQ